jgi:oxalate decarboxylase/phosphoglucose isomerase-like protein (cupin superfamily)
MEPPYRYVFWEGLKDYPGETSRIYSGPLGCENFAFIINRQLPGDSGVMHAHDEAEEVYVLLSGKGSFVTENEDVPMVPLDAVRVPKGVQHTTRNGSDEDVMWLVIGAPADEFIAWDPIAYGPPQD